MKEERLEEKNAPPVFSELDGAIEQLAIAEKRARDAERKLHRLERDLAGVNEDSPEAKDVQELLDLWWVRVKGSHASVGHKLSSSRAAKVRSSLKRRRQIAKENGLPPEEAMLICKKAIIGITCDDWAMGRVAKSQGKAFNDIAEHILNTDGDVEKWAKMFDDWCSHLTMAPLPAETAVRVQQAGVKWAQTRARAQQRALPREPLDAVLDALSATGHEWRIAPGGDRWVAQCPAHNGEHFNLGIDYNRDGSALLLKCWSRGCEAAEVMAALDLPLFVLFRDSERRAA